MTEFGKSLTRGPLILISVGVIIRKTISNYMSQGRKYHLQITNDLQTVLLPPVEDDASTQYVFVPPQGEPL